MLANNQHDLEGGEGKLASAAPHVASNKSFIIGASGMKKTLSSAYLSGGMAVTFKVSNPQSTP